jgi:hypothetical protein
VQPPAVPGQFIVTTTPSGVPLGPLLLHEIPLFATITATGCGMMFVDVFAELVM